MTKFKRTKFRAKNEAEKIQWQKEKFAEGYKWPFGGEEVSYLDYDFFFTNKCGTITYVGNEEYFLNEECEEVFLTLQDPIDQDIADKQSEIEALKKIKLANEKLEQASALNEEARKLLNEAGLC